MFQWYQAGKTSAVERSSLMIFQWAKIFGYLYLLIGILGFIPGITSNGYLLGIFHVNALHNIIHLLTGGLLLWASRRNECATLRSFQVLAVVFGLVSLLGLIYYNSLWLGPLAINIPDTLIHMGFTAVALYCGFLSRMSRTIQCGVSSARA
jgi:hypothetical protein